MAKSKKKSAPSLFLKTEFMLSDEFVATGKWWLHNRKRRKVAGTLRYTHTDIELELGDALESVKASELLTVGKKFADHPCIQGQSNEGKKFTLLRSFVSEYGPTTKYSPIYVIEGAHTTDVASLKVTSVSFYCSHLDSFVACGGIFAVEEERGDNEFKKATITYVQPTKASWSIPSIPATLEIDMQSKFRGGRMSAEIHAQTFVRLIPDTPQDLDWFLKKIWRFCYLLTLLSDERVSPTGIEIFMKGNKHPCWLLYKAGTELPDDEGDTPVQLFHLGHIFNDFASILEKWFTVGDTLLDAIHLTMDAHRNPDQTGQGRFLLLAHAAEVVSRATTSSLYMDPKDYETVRNALTKAIPPNVQKDHKDSLKSRIKYGNEYAFHKRVRLLIESMSKPAQEIVCRNPTAFTRGVSDTRNYYTHFTDELRPKALSPVAMYWASEKLLLLMRIVLLKHLGIDESVIVTRIKNHRRLLQRIFLSKEHPEAAKV